MLEDVRVPSEANPMKPYRNAALFIASLVALVISSAGEGLSADYVVFLVTAALGVLVVAALTAKALRDERSER